MALSPDGTSSPSCSSLMSGAATEPGRRSRSASTRCPPARRCAPGPSRRTASRLGFGWYSGQYANSSITWQRRADARLRRGHLHPGQDGPAGSGVDLRLDVKLRTINTRPARAAACWPTARSSSPPGQLPRLRHPAAHRSTGSPSSAAPTAATSPSKQQRLRPEDLRVHGRDRSNPALVYRRAGVYNYGVANVLWLNADGSHAGRRGVRRGPRWAVGGSREPATSVDDGPISKGILKPIIFPVNGPRFVGGIAF